MPRTRRPARRYACDSFGNDTTPPPIGSPVAINRTAPQRHPPSTLVLISRSLPSPYVAVRPPFDRASSSPVFHFLPDAARAVAEMLRMVCPGGMVTAAVWNNYGDQLFACGAAQFLDGHAFPSVRCPMTRCVKRTASWPSQSRTGHSSTALTACGGTSRRHLPARRSHGRCRPATSLDFRWPPCMA